MKLKENKDLFQAVFNSVSNGIAVLESLYDSTGKIEDFSILLLNNYILNWVGDTDYKGKSCSNVFPMVKETGILTKFIEAAETGITAKFETSYEIGDIKYWFCFTAVKQHEILVVTTDDITESKRSERALSEALDKAEKQKRPHASQSLKKTLHNF